jgi:hypothetical protein
MCAAFANRSDKNSYYKVVNTFSITEDRRPSPRAEKCGGVIAKVIRGEICMYDGKQNVIKKQLCCCIPRSGGVWLLVGESERARASSGGQTFDPEGRTEICSCSLPMSKSSMVVLVLHFVCW